MDFCCSGNSVIRWWLGGDSVIFHLGFLGFLLKHGVVVVVFCLVAEKLIF
jgi:hypothetical protein